MRATVTVMLMSAGLLGLPCRALAQTPAAGAEAAVRQTVETFLTDIGNLDYHKVSGMLTPRALIVIVRQQQGVFVNTTLSGDEWLASWWANPNAVRFQEPLSNVRVTIESDHLAHVRADFRILQNGVAVSSGVDHFTLVRDAKSWKVASVAFTSIPSRIPSVQ
jgi:hypothetical protein